MASEDARKFLDAVDTDPELQQKLKEHHADLVRLGKEQGFDFTPQELRQHLRERWGVTRPPSYDDPDTSTAG